MIRGKIPVSSHAEGRAALTERRSIAWVSVHVLEPATAARRTWRLEPMLSVIWRDFLEREDVNSGL